VSGPDILDRQEAATAPQRPQIAPTRRVSDGPRGAPKSFPRPGGAPDGLPRALHERLRALETAGGAVHSLAESARSVPETPQTHLGASQSLLQASRSVPEPPKGREERPQAKHTHTHITHTYAQTHTILRDMFWRYIRNVFEFAVHISSTTIFI